jgi:hypothetical protein
MTVPCTPSSAATFSATNFGAVLLACVWQPSKGLPRFARFGREPVPDMTSVAHAAAAAAIVTGAERLAAAAFAPLDRKRVGLITNQTDRVGADHLAFC